MRYESSKPSSIWSSNEETGTSRLTLNVERALAFPTLTDLVLLLHGSAFRHFHRGFKALKQLTKITFKLKRFEDSLGYYKRLLPYTKSAVTRK